MGRNDFTWRAIFSRLFAAIDRANRSEIYFRHVEAGGFISFFSSPGYGMIQLNTFKGPWYLIITMLVPGATEAAQKTAAEKLMRDALTKI